MLSLPLSLSLTHTHTHTQILTGTGGIDNDKACKEWQPQYMNEKALGRLAIRCTVNMCWVRHSRHEEHDKRVRTSDT